MEGNVDSNYIVYMESKKWNYIQKKASLMQRKFYVWTIENVDMDKEQK